MTGMRCELLDIQGAQNIRDIGGYPLSDGKILNKRVFIRAGTLAKLTGQGARQLCELGVDCIIDLRSRRERELMPDRLPKDGRVTSYHMPMLDRIQSDLAAGLFQFPESMSEMYCGLLDNDRETFRQIFEVFADKRYKTILYHCTAGKDRTGLTTMLLLGLCGLDDDSIVEDYSYSDKLAKLPHDVEADIPAHVVKSDPEYMRNALAHIRSHYGSVEGYLDKIGVTKAQRQVIIAKLTT